MSYVCPFLRHSLLCSYRLAEILHGETNFPCIICVAPIFNSRPRQLWQPEPDIPRLGRDERKTHTGRPRWQADRQTLLWQRPYQCNCGDHAGRSRSCMHCFQLSLLHLSYAHALPFWTRNSPATMIATTKERRWKANFKRIYIISGLWHS